MGLRQRQEAPIYFSISWCRGYMSLILSAPGKFWSYGAMTLDVVIYSSLFASSQPCSLHAKPGILLSLSGSETSCVTQAACTIHLLNVASTRRPLRSQHFLLVSRAENISLQRQLPWCGGWGAIIMQKAMQTPGNKTGRSGGREWAMSGDCGELQLRGNPSALVSLKPLSDALYSLLSSPFLQERRLAFVQSSKCHVIILCQILGSYPL